MKANELNGHLKCDWCGKPITHCGLPMFWTVKIERHGIDIGAVQRQKGLEMMMGNAVLASVMGPNEDMTRSLMDEVKATLCETCGTDQIILCALAENAAPTEEDDDEQEP